MAKATPASRSTTCRCRTRRWTPPRDNRINSQLSRFNLAQDAVVNAAGNIVCRNTIAQAYGCVPFNPFGGDSDQPGGAGLFRQPERSRRQHHGTSARSRPTARKPSASAVNGSPIDDWAGPVAVAAGYEYREEHYSQRCRSLCGRRHGLHAAHRQRTLHRSLHRLRPDHLRDRWAPTMPVTIKNGRGTYHVNEVFLEFGVPLLNDNFWGKIDLDIAGRHARYSTAGDANTWKVGVTWDTPHPRHSPARHAVPRHSRPQPVGTGSAAGGRQRQLQQRLRQCIARRADHNIHQRHRGQPRS